MLERYQYVKLFYHFLFSCADITSDLLFCYQVFDAKESEARTIFWVLVSVICFSSYTYSVYFVCYIYFTFYGDLANELSVSIILCSIFCFVLLLAPFGQALPVMSVCVSFYYLHMQEDTQIQDDELSRPFYLELFSETILQSVIQFYVLISFSKVSTVQYVSFTISLVNLCYKLWDMFSVSQDEKWQIIMLAVGTWLSVDLLLEFTNLWAFMNLTSGSYQLLGFEHLTIWTMLYYVKVGIIYILMFFSVNFWGIKVYNPENICEYFCIFFENLLLAIFLTPLAFTLILVLKFSLIVPVLTLSVLWFKVRYYQLQEKVEESTEKKLPFLFLVRYSLQSFLPNNKDKSPSTLFIELYMLKVYQRPNSEGYQTANSRRLSVISDNEEKNYLECIWNVLFLMTLFFLGIAYVIQVGSGIYSLFHLVNGLLKGVDPQSAWYVGSLTSMLVVSLVIGVLFTKIMKQKIPKFANLDEYNLADIIHFLKSIDQILIWKKDFESACNSKKTLSLEKVTELTLKNTTIFLPKEDFQDKCNDKNTITTTTSTINFTTDVKESKCNDKNTTTTTTSTINFTTDLKEFTEKEYIMWKVDQERWGAIDCCKECGDSTWKSLSRCYGCRCCFCDRCYHSLHNKIQGREGHEKQNVTDAINPSKFKEENKYNWVIFILATEDRKFNNQNNPITFVTEDRKLNNIVFNQHRKFNNQNNPITFFTEDRKLNNIIFYNQGLLYSR